MGLLVKGGGESFLLVSLVLCVHCCVDLLLFVVSEPVDLLLLLLFEQDVVLTVLVHILQ